MKQRKPLINGSSEESLRPPARNLIPVMKSLSIGPESYRHQGEGFYGGEVEHQRRRKKTDHLLGKEKGIKCR
jgi:hypothetical protein